MNSTEFVFIDLSSIAYPIWHVSQSEPDPNYASQQIASRVRALAQGHTSVAICCDSGRSFRHDIAASYKANRDAKEAPLQHQITLACEQLKADGFPVWSVKGFEADDIIATGVKLAMDIPDATALVVTADKDLLQLVSPRVRAMSVRDGSVLDEQGVAQKFGVLPGQMRDYLTLVGDTADNIKGAKGLGPKKAAELLAKFGALDTVYERLATTGGAAMGLPSSTSAALREFQPQLQETRSLITLRADVAIPFSELNAERVPQAIGEFVVEPDESAEDVDDEVEAEAPAPPTTASTTHEQAPPPLGPGSTIAVRSRDVEVVTGEPVEWERALDPRSMKDARVVAEDLFKSRLFSAYGTPQAVLSTIMVGRELGLPAMGSLRSIHIIEGKHSLSASLMVALVLKSGMAEYFDPIEFDDKHAIFETKRKGGRNPVKLTHTFEMAVAAGLVKPNSGWQKSPTDMLVARAQARLARLVYPDLLAGLYTPEELEDIRESSKAVA